MCTNSLVECLSYSLNLIDPLTVEVKSSNLSHKKLTGIEMDGKYDKDSLKYESQVYDIVKVNYKSGLEEKQRKNLINESKMKPLEQFMASEPKIKQYPYKK